MIVRTQSSTALMWAGVILLLAAFSTGLFGVAEPMLHRHVSSGLVWFTIGAGVGLLGVVLIVVGWRSHAVITADGVHWSTGLGGVTRIGWAQVAQVQIPGRGEPGGEIRLCLHDGSVVPVTPLRRTQSADESTALSPRYLRAGAALQRAHSSWWASRSR